ncbi:MAG: hypothetical protein OXU54_00355, partial [Gammaproteobacteria bacterium]|nr:hypothetical protein [Gammaproteobacteria bacterium]
VRVPRSICAGFPPAREWRIFAVPVGSFSGGSGFSGFLHSLESRNPSCELGIPYEIPAFAGMTEKSRNDRQTE